MSERRCGAKLSLGDDHGDNDCTFHCQKEHGHDGPHEEKSQRGQVVMTFTKNDLVCENCDFHEEENYRMEYWSKYHDTLSEEERDKKYEEMMNNALHTCKINGKTFKGVQHKYWTRQKWCPAMKDGVEKDEN